MNNLVKRAQRVSTTLNVLAWLSLIGGVGIGALTLVGNFIDASNSYTESDGSGPYAIILVAGGVLWWGLLALGGLIADYIADRAHQSV